MLVNCCVSETILSCSAGCVSCCSYVSVKKGARDCVCIGYVDINSWEYEEYWGKKIECRPVSLSLAYAACVYGAKPL